MTTPAFSWITPNNCSDAHDAVCKGNNLSGAFDASGTPNYASPTPNPESTTPKNFTGGLYASDLFLQYYIPLIEQSQAFKQGGLIDITFDEGFPAVHLHREQLQQRQRLPAHLGRTSRTTPARSRPTPRARTSGAGTSTTSRPARTRRSASTPRATSSTPAPGNNAFVDRPPVCTADQPEAVPATACRASWRRRGQPAARPHRHRDRRHRVQRHLRQRDPADDTGRAVTGTSIPANSFVGAVTDTGPNFVTSTTGAVTTGSFQLVGQNGSPVDPTGPVSSITLSAEGDPSDLAAGQTPDPLFNATLPTTGGGDTGSVLISPYIKPGTSTDTYYNHYSWLATMEDIFGVAGGHDHTPLPAGRCPAASTGRATSASPPSRGCARSAGTCSTTRAATARAAATS